MADITITNNNNPLNVFQPRFYINLLEYASLLGEDIHPVHFYQNTEQFEFEELEIPLMADLEYDFIMINGHNFNEVSVNMGGITGVDGILNAPTISDFTSTSIFDNNSVSIFKIDNIIDTTSLTISCETPFKITNFIVGKIYDPPHAVDMSVKQGFDFSGVKNIYNKSGYNYTNVSWFKNPSTMFDQKQPHKKTGRRTFDISFSYLTEANTFPDDLSNLDAHITSTNDDDIYGGLIQKVGNITPFIFEQRTEVDGAGINGNDATNEHLHRNMTLCKFGQKGFSFTQQAPFLYSTKLKLVEIW